MDLYFKLKEQVSAHGVEKASQALQHAFTEDKRIKDAFSFRGLAETLCGGESKSFVRFKESLTKLNQGFRLQEDVDAVNASAFSAITGQLLVTEVKQMYELATFVTDSIFRVIPADKNLETHKVPYMSAVIDDAASKNPLMPFSMTSFKGQYVTLPAPIKKGLICAVDFDAIYADRTNQIVEAAQSVGERVGLTVEEDRLKVFLGIVNNYSFNGTSFNTFQTSTPYINKVTSFALNSYDDVNTLEQLGYQMLDPVTGKNIRINFKDMFVMPARRMRAQKILNATEVREGNQATAGGIVTLAGNPLGNYQLMWSSHARRLLVEASVASPDVYTFVGDFKKAFVEREVHPVEILQAPPGNPMEFMQDIALAVRCKVFKAPGVYDPRFVFLGTA